MQIHILATSRGLTLWWDQMDGAAANTIYTVRWAGHEAQTDRTHFTISGLAPETAVTAAVYCGETLLGEAQGCTEKAREQLLVTDFGAVGDGKTINTKALQAALDACPAGGEVVIPSGVFRTGGLRMHSDMALYLAEGAVLQGTADPLDYLPKIASRFEGIEQECYQSLLNLGDMDHAAGPNCRNVLIYGAGAICGGGQELALNVIEREKVLLAEYLTALGDKIKECENDHTIPGRARGRLINLSNCENVRITGLTLQNGASWNVHMLYSRDITTDHCVFRSEDVWNGDG